MKYEQQKKPMGFRLYLFIGFCSFIRSFHIFWGRSSTHLVGSFIHEAQKTIRFKENIYFHRQRANAFRSAHKDVRMVLSVDGINPKDFLDEMVLERAKMRKPKLSKQQTVASYFEVSDYDGELISNYYNKRWWLLLRRLQVVSAPFLTWYSGLKVDKLTGRQNSEVIEQKRAEELRKLLVALGPTFIKVGQALSNRPDLVGKVYAKELQKLQDRVGSFPNQVAFSIIEESLGRPADAIFEFLEEGPVASASLGQVYKCRIRATGEVVAVKVQRPEAAQFAAVDIAILRAFAGWLMRTRKLRSNLVAIVDEFAARLFDELNYVKESDNCAKFRDLYGKFDAIVCPEPLPQLTTKKVLTQSWVIGDKLPWSDARQLIEVGLECSIYQLLETGFLHADPHPGNLLRTQDGKLAYLDFGMMTQVSRKNRYGLVKAVVNLIDKDFEGLANNLVDLGFLTENATKQELQGLPEALEAAFLDASGGKGLTQLSFSRLTDNMADIAEKFPIQIPPYWSLVIRCLTIQEGIALQDDPNFKVVDAGYPFIVRQFLSSPAPELEDALRQVVLLDTSSTAVAGQQLRGRSDRSRINWSRLKSLLKTASSSKGGGSSKSEKGKPSTSTSEKLGELAQDDQLVGSLVSFLLSDRGVFLRDALVEDAVDVIEDVGFALQRAVSLGVNNGPDPPRGGADRERITLAASLLQKLVRDKVTTGSSPFKLDEAGWRLQVGQKGGFQSQSQQDIQETLELLSRQILASFVERRMLESARLFFQRLENIFSTDR
mmetsp:Transcript_27763/g.36392  ORF Transcript_27763/g.36392 Transcript_27763/m.36392 type:complete len:773 (+) Transcript_27763:38-2356(+)